MTRVSRPCLGCNTPTSKGPYCPRCQIPSKTRAARPHYQGNWDKLSKETRRQHLETYGPICPGYKREPHPVDPNQLTTDHQVPRDPTYLGVLCRSCNSTKGNDER